VLFQLVTSLHIFICVVLIILVLVQQGQGADAGVSFGGGGNTFFGASGADTFITKFTTALALCFMLTSVYLSLHSRPSSPTAGRLFQNAPKAVTTTKEVTIPDTTKAMSETGTVTSNPIDATPTEAAKDMSTKANNTESVDTMQKTEMKKLEPIAEKKMADVKANTEKVVTDTLEKKAK